MGAPTSANRPILTFNVIITIWSNHARGRESTQEMMSRAFDSNQRLILLRPALVVTPSIQGMLGSNSLAGSLQGGGPTVQKFENFKGAGLIIHLFL